MPMLEVIVARKIQPSPEAKKAFAQEAHQIFAEVIGTPKGRMRLVIYPVEPDPEEQDGDPES
ncbi:MAG: tautomerase family protein [Meiothermus ruber]|uniref:tautomerase family protein n=1 Tax=Meiothermus ruber TaxID=277 RepID=UPI00391A8D85